MRPCAQVATPLYFIFVFHPKVPNAEKLMTARRRRRSAFIVSRCLEPLRKNEARVVDVTYQRTVLNGAH